MEKVIKSLKKSELGQRIALIIANIINFSALMIFMMLSTGIADVYNARFDTSDAGQIWVILCSVIGIAIICILILQWIIITLLRSIFDSREKFNINLRLIGCSKSDLKQIYIKEILHMQIIVLPIGIFLAEGFWRLIMAEIDHDFGFWIGMIQIIYSLIIHLVTALLSSYFILKKLCKFDIVAQLRNSERNISSRKITVFNLIYFIFGLGLIIVNHVFYNNINKALSFFIDFIGFLFALDVIILSINYILLYISKKLNINFIIISQINILGYYNKIKKVIIILLLGVSMSVGLQMAVHTTQEDAYLYSLANIKYSDSFEYDDFIDENYINNIVDKYNVDYSTGIYFLSDKNEQEVFFIQGIDEDHISKLEQIKMDKKISNLNINSVLNNPDFNGIILPKTYITKNNIGKSFNVNYTDYNNQMCEFKIAGGCSTNNAARWCTGIVSKSYLQRLLNQDGKINIIYLSNMPEGLKQELTNIDGVKVKEHLTKLDIANESREKAVSSTIVLLVPAIVIFICAIAMMTSVFVINKKQNTIDISKLRGFGLNKISTISIYIFQILNIILTGFILGIFGSLQICDTIMIFWGEEYRLSKIIWPYSLIFTLLITIVVILIVIFSFSVKKGLSKNFVNILRED